MAVRETVASFFVSLCKYANTDRLFSDTLGFITTTLASKLYSGTFGSNPVAFRRDVDDLQLHVEAPAVAESDFAYWWIRNSQPCTGFLVSTPEHGFDSSKCRRGNGWGERNLVSRSLVGTEASSARAVVSCSLSEADGMSSFTTVMGCFNRRGTSEWRLHKHHR